MPSGQDRMPLFSWSTAPLTEFTVVLSNKRACPISCFGPNRKLWLIPQDACSATVGEYCDKELGVDAEAMDRVLWSALPANSAFLLTSGVPLVAEVDAEDGACGKVICPSGASFGIGAGDTSRRSEELNMGDGDATRSIERTEPPAERIPSGGPGKSDIDPGDIEPGGITETRLEDPLGDADLTGQDRLPAV